MDVREFYDDRWQAENVAGPIHARAPRDPLHRFLLDPIFDPFANPRHEVALGLLEGGERLLDIGCWNGGFLENVREAGLNREVEGVDLVEAGVAAAVKRGLSARVVDLNREPLPFPDAHFDGISLLAVLEHVFDPYFTLGEVRRVLRPGGELVVDVPNAGSLTNRLRLLFGRIPVTSADAGWDGGHLHYFTRHALDRLLDGEGFDVRARRTTGGRPWLREWWISLMGGEFVYHCRRR